LIYISFFIDLLGLRPQNVQIKISKYVSGHGHFHTGSDTGTPGYYILQNFTYTNICRWNATNE